jgi:hypothetical protein
MSKFSYTCSAAYCMSRFQLLFLGLLLTYAIYIIFLVVRQGVVALGLQPENIERT